MYSPALQEIVVAFPQVLRVHFLRPRWRTEDFWHYAIPSCPSSLYFSPPFLWPIPRLTWVQTATIFRINMLVEDRYIPMALRPYRLCLTFLVFAITRPESASNPVSELFDEEACTVSFSSPLEPAAYPHAGGIQQTDPTVPARSHGLLSTFGHLKIVLE